jgi:NHLM bacteriocin system ABC transporter ATP-binding protein
MNAPSLLDRAPGLPDLASLDAPGRLMRPARLYAVVRDGAGNPGAHQFLARLPEGAAVFALAAPGVSFLLYEQGARSPQPLIGEGPIDADAIDRWYGALLAVPGLPRGDAESIPVEPGDRRIFAAGAHVTARQILWLEADAPILLYPASHGVEASAATARLVLAAQVRVAIAGEGEVRAIDTATLLARQSPAALGGLSAPLARHIAGVLVRRDTARRQRWQQTREIDETRAAHAFRRMRDVARFRRLTPVPTARLGQDPLAGVLGIMADVDGFELRTPVRDRPRDPLFERLKAYAFASGFRFREIMLEGEWWRREAPPFIAMEREQGREQGKPLAMVFRRRRWHIVDPETLAETVVDRAAAARLQPTGYMLYPPLPDRPDGHDIWRFSTFGVRGDIRRLVIASGAASAASLLMPIATGAILGVAIPDGRYDLLADMLLLLVAAGLGSLGFQMARTMSLVRLGTHLDQRLQAAVWDRVLRLRMSFFRRYLVGDLTWRIMGVDSMRRILTGQSVNAVIGGVFSLASLGVMLAYDVAMSMFAIAYAIVAGCLLFVVGRVQKRLQLQVFDQTGRVSGLLIELVSAIAKLRVAAAELRAFTRWSNAFIRQRLGTAGALRMNAIQAVAATSLPFVGAIGLFGIAGGGGDPVDVGSFAAFYAAFGQFTAAILALANALNVSIDVLPLFSRLRPVLAAPLEVEQRRIDPGPLGGAITVRDLWFRYSDDGPWALEGIDLALRPGESVAIVGPSGSGKSTLLRLLLGLEAPTRGSVSYDDNDLKDLDPRLVRRQIGTVLDGSTLFPGSLYENIAGSSPLSREEVLEAVRLAGLEADIAGMPMGLESVVTERGNQISGGQRQRVIIARALVNRPRLLFLDEATSALDNRTQAIVQQSIARMNATRIVVAHRLSTIRDVDRIVVLEGGRIVESGSYDELIARRGAFHRLARRQLL